MPPSSRRIPLLVCCWMFCFFFASHHRPPTIRAFSTFAKRSTGRSTILSRGSIGATTRLYQSTVATTSVETAEAMSTTSKTTKKTMPPAAANKKEKMCSYPIEMTEAEKYLFDLNGYLIVRNVLTPDEVEEANSVIDRHEHEMVERTDKDLRNTQPGSSYAGNGTTGRMDLGQCLEWGSDSQIFKSILAHPRLVPIFHELLGKGYRMDHLPLILAQEQHSEGFQLHGGTIDCTSGEYQPHLAYTYNHGMLRTALLGCNVILRDHKAGDGGFCIVPGSHKANFKMPPGMVEGNAYADYVRQPTTNAGDVILFSEGTVHGAKVRGTRTVLADAIMH